MPIFWKGSKVGAMIVLLDQEVCMDKENSPERKKKKSGGGFLIYALFVFTALAVALVVILRRSKGY